MVTTRTVYRLMIQDAELGNLLPAPVGPDCVDREVAKRAELKTHEETENLVLVEVNQRKGGDGLWHDAGLTVMEVL